MDISRGILFGLQTVYKGNAHAKEFANCEPIYIIVYILVRKTIYNPFLASNLTNLL